MKNASILWIAAIAVAMSACKEDTTEPGVPVQTGDEISFGATPQSENGAESRTSYGEEYKGEDGAQYVKVNWVQDDQIAVYCEQASQPADHLVKYKITPDKENASESSLVTKMDEVGLQWGSSDLHEFYGFYPANRLERVENGKLYASVPVDQQPVSWHYDKANSTWIGEPNMEYAYMYAYNSVSKSDMTQGKDVPLDFHPLVTVLEITVNGPEQGTMSVSNINVNAIAGENVILTGEFCCDLSPTADPVGHCYPTGSTTGQVRNRVSITCYNPEAKDFISLGPGEKLKVKAFFIPNDNQTITPRQLQVSVSPLNGANLVRTLQKDNIAPHKINRVILAPLRESGINYWMSSLDPNIYLTELSIPGSKMSALTSENGSEVVYQMAELGDQFDLGVRSFIFQTGARHVGGRDDLYIAIGDNKILGEGEKQSVQSFLQDLVTKIQQAQQAKRKNEFVVVTLTFAEGATENNSDYYSKQEYWIQTLCNKLKDYLRVDGLGTYIYNGEITPFTTLGDVAGKILIKVNVNNTAMGNWGSDGMPAMFALWSGAYPENGVPLYWGSSRNLDIPSDMTWLYQEATSVNDNGGYDATFAQKEEYIRQMFKASIKAYQDDSHNTWFMNDLGGWLNKNSTDGTKDLAGRLTPTFFDELQQRTENAALGLIYMNFADKEAGYGQDFKSPQLIQTVIDNNFKFQLRTKGNDQSGTRIEAATRTGSDGWDE